MQTAHDVLARKGSLIYSIPPTATVLDATQRMNHHRIGALVVMADGRMLGIFTERDVLRRVVGEHRDPADVLLYEVMTSELITCTPESAIDDLAETMRVRRVRHLPVMDDDGTLLGLVSIGDVNAHHAAQRRAELLGSHSQH